MPEVPATCPGQGRDYAVIVSEHEDILPPDTSQGSLQTLANRLLGLHGADRHMSGRCPVASCAEPHELHQSVFQNLARLSLTFHYLGCISGHVLEFGLHLLCELTKHTDFGCVVFMLACQSASSSS